MRPERSGARLLRVERGITGREAEEGRQAALQVIKMQNNFGLLYQGGVQPAQAAYRLDAGFTAEARAANPLYRSSLCMSA